MIKDHPWIGKPIRYSEAEKATGIITGVRKARGMIINTKTLTMQVGYQLRIKPDDGGPAFWSCTVCEPHKKAEEALKDVREEAVRGGEGV